MLKVPLAKFPDPHTIVKKLLKDEKEKYIMLLESGKEFSEQSRYTIVAWGSKKSLIAYFEDGTRSKESAKRVYVEFKKLLEETLPDYKPFGGRPLIGYLSYEANVLMEHYLREFIRQDMSRWPWPLVELYLPEYVIIYDKLLQRVQVFGLTERDIEQIRKDSNDITIREVEIGDIVAEVSKEKYIEWVTDALKRIHDGEIFQIVLSRYMDIEFTGELFTVYRRLANLNPSPYQFYLKFENRVLLGSSPELLVGVQGDKVETYPIAGTRPRGKTPEEDLKLEEELLKSEKDFAEHIMLVDLARNDLGKICRFGTVRVTDFMFIEKYSHVQHLVTRVEGVLMPSMDIVDALWATFPAGTVTGAPKPRAMELIYLYEDRPRGPYAGCVGLACKRSGKFAITIRSMFAIDNIVTLQAGAGIVYDSVPELEYLETEHKLAALKQSLELHKYVQ